MDDGRKPRFGLMLKATALNWSTPSGASIRLSGQKSGAMRTIIPKDFDFVKLGIGGLNNEFNQIFRRAFASRIYPTHLVEQMVSECVTQSVRIWPSLLVLICLSSLLALYWLVLQTRQGNSRSHCFSGINHATLTLSHFGCRPCLTAALTDLKHACWVTSYPCTARQPLSRSRSGLRC